MSAKFWRSLLVRTALGVVGISALIGGLVMLSAATEARKVANSEVARRLTELVDTVQNTTSIACFVGDKQLAAELAQGLLRNSEVALVVIRAEGQILAKVGRMSFSDDADELPLGPTHPIVRPVYSPFDATRQIGEITLIPDAQRIGQIVRDEGERIYLILAIQLIAVAAAAVASVLYLIVRPIQRMSDELHRLDATAGQLLPVPVGHERNELGRLAGDINDLAGRLVSTLEDEHALRLQREVDERKFRAIFDNAESGILLTDGSGEVISFNPSFLRLCGLTEGQAPASLKALAWQHGDELLGLIHECADSGRALGGDFLLELADGESRWLSFSFGAVGGGQIQGVVIDVTARKTEEVAARLLAVTDSLTGLGNRAALEQHLGELMGVSGAGFVMLLLDIDGFRRVNESLGLVAGDEVLRQSAYRLRGHLPGAWLARVGADEFAAVLPPGAEADSAAFTALVEAMALPFELHEQPLFLGASIGLVRYPADGTDIPGLLRNADLALERVRREGGQGFRCFEPGMAEQAERRRRMEKDLRLAVQQNELQLYYQPIIDLKENRLAGAEALIRWRHPEQGMISPDVFIPLAEESGMIRDIGLWVLNEASTQLAAWRGAGMDMYVSVNVSVKQIPDDLPAQVVLDTTRSHGIEPDHIALEITEGVLMSDVSHGLAWLESLNQAGFRLYLDDFGTGYSSLSYLKRFPMDTVKVDKSFVRDMSADNNDRALVGAIVMMAKGLGLSTVAEGVETDDQLLLLKALSCRYAQGYLFSKPVPAAEFPALRARINGELALASGM
ncbi:MAG TPA: bifunctional diguanylate cyclase/phosphodiesterase [Rhodocyclaceae bacterium]